MGGLMRFIHLFLVGYFLLLVGAVMALWQAGVLGRISPLWIAIGVIISVGLGIMLAVSSGKPVVTRDEGTRRSPERAKAGMGYGSRLPAMRVSTAALLLAALV